MPNTRDPRTDPRPGDVLQKAGKVRQVTGVIPGAVEWCRSMSEYGVCRMLSWRKWAATATVIKTAESEGK